MHTGFVIGIAVAFVIAGAATAGPFEDGVAAHEHGDYARALRLLRPLAEQGNATAELHLGSMYHEGEGVPQDYAEAAKWFRKAAEQGTVAAQLKLSLMYDEAITAHERGDYETALREFLPLAEQGEAHASRSIRRQPDTAVLEQAARNAHRKRD